jgi:hypothetical protein
MEIFCVYFSGNELSSVSRTMHELEYHIYRNMDMAWAQEMDTKSEIPPPPPPHRAEGKYEPMSFGRKNIKR